MKVSFFFHVRELFCRHNYTRLILRALLISIMVRSLITDAHLVIEVNSFVAVDYQLHVWPFRNISCCMS